MKRIVLDKDSLLRFYAYCHEDIIEILQEYVKNGPSMKEQLYQAFISDTAELKSCLHYNAAAFTYTGFPQLTAAFKELSDKCAAIRHNNEVEKDVLEILSMLDASVSVASQEIINFKNDISIAIAI